MAYTPINWQTGDTITAAKLNRCDNGWGYESTQLFSETVTTADQGGMYSAELAYAQLIDADAITVTFDGTEYVCPRIDLFDECFYGGFSEQGPDYTNYPFALESNPDGNNLYTETAGAHTLAVVAPSLQTSADFSRAVSASAFYPLVIGTTTWSQVVDAMAAGKLVFRTWAAAYEDVTLDDQYAGLELVTDAYVSSHGDYTVSAIVVQKGVQSVASYTATTEDEALS